jgi:glucosamine-6-phosphate isomerase
MNIVIAKNYETLSSLAADDLIKLIHPITNPLICPASGNTPVGLYKQLVDRYKKQELDVSEWNFVGLDEWVAMNEEDQGSCRQTLNEVLLKPMNIDPERICFFDGKAANLEDECLRAEQFIKEKGGIDIAVLGLGMNGHIGFNEPGSAASLRSHIVELDAVTKQVGQKYFNEKKQLSQGITLGFATLLEAKHIFLLVSGVQKAAIVKQVIEGPITEQVPGSVLRKHPNLTVYLDSDAASLLSK